MSFTLNELF